MNNINNKNKIKSIDFKIEAKGSGIVNWNGSFNLYSETAKSYVNNHQLPKMRNVDPMRLKSLNDKELEKAKLIVSQNCFRHEIFKNETMNLQNVNANNVLDVLTSILGLVRGYVIADEEIKLSLKRKSCLLLEDLVDNQTVLKYEQFSNSGERNSTSIYSKTNADETFYIGYGSIVVEDLQFIVLEDSFGRSAYKNIITEEDGKYVEEKLNEYLKTLDFDGNKNPQATFAKNYIRIGSIMKTGEAGILLNDDAIDLIIKEILNRIENVFLKQSKGYLAVTKLLIDYNNGTPMRIKNREDIIQQYKNENYAIYYYESEMSSEDFEQKNQKIEEKAKARKKAKDLEKKRKEEFKQQKKLEENNYQQLNPEIKGEI